jgi:hypothetical protein
MRRVYHEPLEVGVGDENFQKPLPLPIVSPAAKSAVDIFPVPIVGWKVSPGCSRTQYPKDPVDELPVVFGISSPGAFSAFEKWLKYLPEPV